MAALEAGADEFLTEAVRTGSRSWRACGACPPQDDDRRAAHARSAAGNEWRRRADGPGHARRRGRACSWSKIKREIADAIRLALSPKHRVYVEKDAEDALLLVRRAELDLIAVDLSLAGADGLRVCSRLRALEETRRTPLLAIDWTPGRGAQMRALDLGVAGFVTLPIHPGELLAHVDSQVRRKRYWDQSAPAPAPSLEQAAGSAHEHARSALSGEASGHARLPERRCAAGPCRCCSMDVDHFKAVNDTYGHDVGDEVLREIARRISSSLRGLDLSCRFGGEEFVAVFPGVDGEIALLIGERLRRNVADRSVPDRDRGAVRSRSRSRSGRRRPRAATTPPRRCSSAPISALYRAKKEGRNRVVACAIERVKPARGR